MAVCSKRLISALLLTSFMDYVEHDDLGPRALRLAGLRAFENGSTVHLGPLLFQKRLK